MFVACALATMAIPDLDLLDASPFNRLLGGPAVRDQRTLKILAKTVYRELRAGGLAEEEVMTITGELLHLVAVDLKDRRRAAAEGARTLDSAAVSPR